MGCIVNYKQSVLVCSAFVLEQTVTITGSGLAPLRHWAGFTQWQHAIQKVHCLRLGIYAMFCCGRCVLRSSQLTLYNNHIITVLIATWWLGPEGTFNVVYCVQSLGLYLVEMKFWKSYDVRLFWIFLPWLAREFPMFGISMDTISESPTVCKSLSEVLLMSS